MRDRESGSRTMNIFRSFLPSPLLVIGGGSGSVEVPISGGALIGSIGLLDTVPNGIDARDAASRKALFVVSGVVP